MELFVHLDILWATFMPYELVEKLNSKMSDKLKSYADNLVGKEELAFDEEILL